MLTSTERRARYCIETMLKIYDADHDVKCDVTNDVGVRCYKRCCGYNDVMNDLDIQFDVKTTFRTRMLFMILFINDVMNDAEVQYDAKTTLWAMLCLVSCMMLR